MKKKTDKSEIVQSISYDIFYHRKAHKKKFPHFPRKINEKNIVLIHSVKLSHQKDFTKTSF